MNATWLALLFNGLRLRNVRDLRWEDIKLEQKVLTIGGMKNGQKRTYPLCDMSVDVFNHTPHTHDQIVFNGRHYGKPIIWLRQINLKGEDVDNGGFLQNRQQYSALSQTFSRTIQALPNPCSPQKVLPRSRA